MDFERRIHCFECRFCEGNFRKVAMYVSHLDLHRHLIGSTFPCAVKSCSRILNTQSALRSHLNLRHHLLVQLARPQEPAVCPLNAQGRIMCSVPSCQTEFQNKRSLISHLGSHMAQGREVSCPFPSCDRVYSLPNSLTGHISKYHGSIPQVLADLETAGEESVSYADHCLAGTEETLTREEETILSQSVRSNWKENLAQFFLKLQFKHLLPASTVQVIAVEMRKLQDQALMEVCDDSSRVPIAERIQNLQSGFFDLRTSHRRLSFYKNHYLFVRPSKKDMGGGKYFFYVSIKSTLQKMMEGHSWNLDLHAPTQSRDGVLRDFHDGLVYKNNDFFKENPKAFRIILFQDAFEPANPLGSAKLKHKMLGVYMSLGNIPEHLRGRPETIQLVALCLDKQLKHDRLFGAIASELRELETEGVYIPGHGMVKGSLVYVCGDNLGSHGVGGFHEQFTSSVYFCRYCLVTKTVFKSEGGHNYEFPQRTPANYALAVRGKNIHEKQGIKFNSKLNSLQHFHVCKPGLPPCLGHDIMEGLASYDLALILHYLIDEEWFTMDQLNNKISSFPYSSRDRRDRPIPFSSDYIKVKGKMWQIYNSIRLFPVMLAEFVQDEMHPAWQMLLLLGNMLDILCAPTIHVSWTAVVRRIIWKYMELRTSFFSWIPLRPKHHYLTHYWSLILYFGPLGKVWTLRFESKHSFFKNAMRSSRNWINVMKSCSNRHEMYQAYLRAGGDTRSDTYVVKASPYIPGAFHFDIQRAVLRVLSVSSLQFALKAYVKGTMYEKGHVVPLEYGGVEDHVTFGRILMIVFHEESSLFFVMEILESAFVPLSRVYQLGERKHILCLPLCELPSYSPLDTYRYGRKKIVKLKHALVEHDADSAQPPTLFI